MGDRDRSDQGTDPDRRRSAAFFYAGECKTDRSCHRVQDQCGKSGEEFPSVSGNDHRYVSAGRKGCADRFSNLQWIHRTAILRQYAGKADRICKEPYRGDPEDAECTW